MKHWQIMTAILLLNALLFAGCVMVLKKTYVYVNVQDSTVSPSAEIK